MTTIDIVAKELHMRPNELLHESLRTYLERRLAKVEAEIFALAKKYGVKDVFELDTKVKDGLIKEENAHEDYFNLDNLEADRDKIKKLLEEFRCQ
ncbi:MAG: hypothetical protein SCALA701_29670 [Candidatus Scalindua sp.]|nr:hypothetical protein [Planctomycetota bacterium]RZV69647.1 MAG: hypothetical protein EX341_15945 [Candidatus Scalindua sp. SCAELEC01]GJQ60166.1 MAG: hypothetical protein SCALA701_29670 [Candidatus Scalindua sp.]